MPNIASAKKNISKSRTATVRNRAQRMEVVQKQNAAIRTVLTADQQKVFDKNVADMAQQMGRPRP